MGKQQHNDQPEVTVEDLQEQLRFAQQTINYQAQEIGRLSTQVIQQNISIQNLSNVLQQKEGDHADQTAEK